MNWFKIFLYVSLINVSLWAIYYFLVIFIKSKQYTDNKLKVGVVIPCYNEDLDKLEQCIISIKNAKKVHQIIVIDDGSTVNPKSILKKHLKPSEYYICKTNGGKRQAHYIGITKLRKEIDLIVFVDSDTIINENSIIELTKPFSDSKVGATTGQVLVMNQNENLITKMSSAMFWSSMNVSRLAMNKLNVVQNCSGALSCYRKENIDKILLEYRDQTFMHRKCALSDDTFLTFQTHLTFNQEVIYVENAIAYTYIPNDIKTTYKMIKRWRIGGLRENILLLKDWHKAKLLTFHVWLQLLVEFIFLIFRILVIVFSIFNPMLMVYYLISILITSCVKNYYILINEPRLFMYEVGYSYLNEFVYSWAFLESIIRINQQSKWVTR